MHDTGDVAVTKAAIDPVWYLPGIAERFGVTETALRRTLFEQTGGMYADLVTRPDIKVFLPPIGGITLYIFGDPAAIAGPARPLTCRVHDECNGSDVFGSDICTCRPYLTHGIEECVHEAQNGGAGLIVYNRKEGRALGEVTKFLVYNARKRQPGGDQAATYFERTECVAGVQDARFQQLMPDILHWLGITRIDRFVSMSNMKHDALTGSGIEIGERVPVPDYLIPPDASAEMAATARDDWLATLELQADDLARAMRRRQSELAQTLDWLSRRLVSPAARIAHERIALRGMQWRMAHATGKPVEQARLSIMQLGARLAAQAPRTPASRMRLAAQASRLAHHMQSTASQHRCDLEALSSQLELLNPQRTLERGYAMVTDAKGKIVRSPADLQPRQAITLRLASGTAEVGIASVQASLE